MHKQQEESPFPILSCKNFSIANTYSLETHYYQTIWMFWKKPVQKQRWEKLGIWILRQYFSPKIGSGLVGFLI